MLKKAYKRFLLFSVVFVVCGIMLTSVDDCEEGYEGYYEEYALADSGQNISQSQGTQGSGQSGTTAKSQTTGGTGTAATGSGQTAAQPAKTQPASTASQSGQSGAAQPAKTQQPASTQTASSSGSQPAKTQLASTGSQSGQSGAAPAKTQQPASTQTASSSGSQPASTGSQASQSGQSGAAPAALSSISGKNWKLVEVRKDSRVIEINRQKLETDGFGDLFTIVFGDRISGRAAPNRFTAPYQAGANNALTIQQPASTMMAAIYDPERIHEKDYFQYLTGVKSWKLNQNRLELYSSDAGKETVLVYGN